ncbi:MAG: alpha-ketoglutarate-dependent dioxygenase AlkB [Bacteroidota bacterium]|nr:alpha-ketoglutarate-dependent dioxygenase AlkB [Bacteroidota bacterium]
MIIKPNTNLLPQEGEVLFFPDFFNFEDSNRLFKSLTDNIEWKQEQIKGWGKVNPVPRLTAWYGDSGKTYKYSGISHTPNPWTKELLEIKNKIEKIAKVKFSSVLLNLYRDGKDSVWWHSDDEKELGTNPVIGSVSFGASRTFKFQHKEDKSLKTQVDLTHGSFVLMQGETQHKWNHAILKTKKVLLPRINLTFRVIR